MRNKYLKQIVKKCEKIPNMEFKFVLEELQNLSDSLIHLEHEVFIKVKIKIRKFNDLYLV